MANTTCRTYADFKREHHFGGDIVTLALLGEQGQPCLFEAPNIQTELKNWCLGNPAESVHFIVDGLENARDLRAMLAFISQEAALPKLTFESLSDWAQCHQGDEALSFFYDGHATARHARLNVVQDIRALRVLSSALQLSGGFSPEVVPPTDYLRQLFRLETIRGLKVGGQVRCALIEFPEILELCREKGGRLRRALKEWFGHAAGNLPHLCAAEWVTPKRLAVFSAALAEQDLDAVWEQLMPRFDDDCVSTLLGGRLNFSWRLVAPGQQDRTTGLASNITEEDEERFVSGLIAP